MLSDRAVRHAAALRALLGIGALRGLGRVDLGGGLTTDAESVAHLILGALDDLEREAHASRGQWGIVEEYVERAHAAVTGVLR